jgi:hypothetical protein
MVASFGQAEKYSEPESTRRDSGNEVYPSPKINDDIWCGDSKTYDDHSLAAALMTAFR